MILRFGVQEPLRFLRRRIAILSFLLFILITLQSYGQSLERNPKEAYFEVGQEGYIKEWLVIGPFPKEMEADFLQAQDGEANIRSYEGMLLTTPDGKTYTWKRYQSQDDFINLQYAMKQLLFYIDSAFQSELNNGNEQLSKKLRQEFENHGISLSQNATISIEQKSSRWQINDGDNQQWYPIAQEEGKLNIYNYGAPKNVVVYAACNVLSPKDQQLEMLFSSNNAVKVWLNGHIVHSNPTAYWQEYRFGLILKSGVNRCLIKVGQGAEGWGFNTKVQNHEAYLRSLQLKLTVRRQNPGGQDTLTISTRREPQSPVWQLPSLPVRIELRDKASRLLATLKAREGEPVVWTAPEDVQGTVSILATQTDSLGRKLEARFTCRAHNITPIMPRVGHWETYDVTNGLGCSSVMSIIQDRNGVLWFGLMEGGASRYDGRTFRTFTTKDGLPSNNVFTIFEDSSGNLWFGTMNYYTQKGAGVCKYDGKTFQTFTTKDGLADDTIVAIYEDNHGHLWFGAYTKGVSEFDGKTFRNYTTEDGLPSAPVGTITQDKDGNLWFGHGLKAFGWGAGATRYDGKSFTHFTTRDGLVDDGVTSITADAQGNLWFATTGGVSVYDGKVFQNFTTTEGLANDRVNDVLQTKSGDLWFATWGGVSRYREGKFQNFTTKEGLAHDWALCVTEDREGNLWFGTLGGGISRYDGSVLSIPVSIWGSYPIRDAQGNLWFGFPGGGLGRCDERNIRTFAMEDGLLNNTNKKIYEDSRGNIWFGTWGGGLARYDGEKFQTFTTKIGLSSNYVWALWEDRKGILWIGTQEGGVCTYNGKKFVKVAGEQELSSGWIWISYILEDRKGNMWFSMPGHGVCKYDGTKFTRFTTENGLPHNTSFNLLEDRSGNIWIATQGGGACRYDGQNFRTFTTKDGLVGDWLEGIFEDSRGNLWLSVGTGGFNKFDGKNFQMFTTDDGLLSNSAANVLEDEKGNLIFATGSGFTIYTPPKEKIAPPIFVTEVVADKVYPVNPSEGSKPSEGLKIPSTAKHISFAYHGLSFKTKQIRYNYMLEGYDKDWQATWDEEVSYDNLKSGSYVFKVIAINRDLVYSEAPAMVHLTIAPPFYMTAGFLVPTGSVGTLLLATLTVLAVGFIKHRRQVLAYQRAAVEELQDARQMQMSLIPETAPPIEGVEVAGKCISANTVGGDFFDYLEGKTPSEIALVIGDVSGKGLKGAMNAVMTDGILHSVAKGQEKLSPASLMVGINDVLKTRMEQEMNVTMVIAVIDRNRVFPQNSVSMGGNSVSEVETTLTLANAAHHAHPLLLRNGEIQALKTGGLPLGMRAGIKYSEAQFPLQSGDVLVLMTDGIIEAKDSNEQLYSDSGRLEKTISQFTQEQSAETMVEALLNDAMDFGSGKTSRDDDMTVVVAKVQ
ncbi:hypothetical protein FJZ31_07595 [Candidatus Poribacteria bacterium]|nr:hypothetical protein [Candidatus Poribacteria bacterium]